MNDKPNIVRIETSRIVGTRDNGMYTIFEHRGYDNRGIRWTFNSQSDDDASLGEFYNFRKSQE